MTRNETELWTQILAGDAGAWKTLVDRYGPLVLTVGLRTGLSQHEANDCFQHTWLALFENRRQIADPSALSGWLATTARREALRLLTRRGDAIPVEHQREEQDPRPLPDEELENLQRQAVLENAIEIVGGRCKKILDALFFSPAEMSYAEVSKSLGIPPNSLGPNRMRCLEKLRQTLTQMNVHPGQL